MAVPRDPTPLQKFIANCRSGKIPSSKIAGWSQAKLANALGLAVGEHVSLIEKGARRLPLGRIPLLADALGFKRLDICKWALREEEPLFYKILYPGEIPTDSPEASTGDVALANELASKIVSLPPALRQSVELLVDQAYSTQLTVGK